jgi:tetratricopeptide (TPR) repeat protein
MLALNSLLLAVGITVALILAATLEPDGIRSELLPFPPETRAYLQDIRDRTAEIRGLPVKEDIAEGYVPASTLRDYARDRIGGRGDESLLELEQLIDVYILLHLLEPDFDLQEFLTMRAGTGIAGLYSPDEDALILVGRLDTEDVGNELTLSHEYAHSFQDQSFDFAALDEIAEQKLTEYGRTAGCIVEGDATATSWAYMESKYGEDWTGELIDGDEAAGPRNVPLILAFEESFPYGSCAVFVSAIREVRGWEGVNDLYRSIPTTSEQVLHPDKYIRGELAKPLKTKDLTGRLGEGWRQVDTRAYGEFDVLSYLLSLRGIDALIRGDDYEDAIRAASGWGAGWLSYYSDGEADEGLRDGGYLVHIALEWDADADITEFRNAYHASLKANGVANQPAATTNPVWQWADDDEAWLVLWSQPDRRVDIVTARDAETADRALIGVGDAWGQQFVLGMRAFDRGEVETAIRLWTDSIALNARNTPALSFRGLVYARTNRLDLALADFSASIAIDPGRAGDYYRHRGQIHLRLGNLDAAIADLTAAIELWDAAQAASRLPQSLASAYYSRAGAYEALGRTGEAIADLEAALPHLEGALRIREGSLTFSADPIPVWTVLDRLAELRAQLANAGVP